MSQQSVRSEFLLTLDTAYRILGFVVEKSYYLVAVFVVATVAAFFIASQTPAKYEAEVVLVLAPPPFKQGNDNIAGLLPRTLTIQDYEIIVRSDPVIKQLRDRANWSDNDGRPEKLRYIREDIRANVRVIRQTATDVQYSPVLILAARGTSGEIAAQRANAWASVAIEASRNYGRFGAGGTLEILKTEYLDTAAEYETSIDRSAARNDELRAAVVAANERMLKEVARFSEARDLELAALAEGLQTDLLTKRLEAIRGQLATRLDLLADAELEAETLEREVAILETELQSLPERLTLNKGLTDTAIALLAAQENRLPDAMAGRTIVAEERNEVYTEVRALLATKRGKLAAAARRKEAIERQIQTSSDLFEKTLQQSQAAQNAFQARKRELLAEEQTLTENLQREVDVKEQLAEWELKKIDTELKNLGEYYSALNSKTLSARLAEAEIEPDLRLLSAAIPSLYDLPRGRTVKALAAGLFAFGMALLILLLVSGYREHARTGRQQA
ncbi:MAG: hypothetical protein KF858_05525 [Candidatus Sumerlaeia bacterium]|nr:hypothetical protein [Candidatus Sumerlaeia bacterium]